MMELPSLLHAQDDNLSQMQGLLAEEFDLLKAHRALALPALAAAREVGLVTAPGGRGMLTPALEARGATVMRADVYDRVPLPLATAAIDRLLALDAPAALALSSGEALQQVLAQLPAPAAASLRRTTAVAASERLAALARASGWSQVVVAGSPRPGALAAAAAHAFSRPI